MTNAESKQQYEGAILNQLIKNSERLVVIERDIAAIKNGVNKIDDLSEEMNTLKGKVDYIYGSLKWIIGLLGTVLVAVLANLLSQPVLSLFN